MTGCIRGVLFLCGIVWRLTNNACMQILNSVWTDRKQCYRTHSARNKQKLKTFNNKTFNNKTVADRQEAVLQDTLSKEQAESQDSQSQGCCRQTWGLTSTMACPTVTTTASLDSMPSRWSSSSCNHATKLLTLSLKLLAVIQQAQKRKEKTRLHLSAPL